MRERRLKRLRDYDYSRAGGYFITICASNREHLFGEIINQEMMLNDAGRIVKEWWVKLEKEFPRVKLDDYVIMPNHTHGIVMIVEGEWDDAGAIHERGDVGAIHERGDVGAIHERGDVGAIHERNDVGAIHELPLQ